MSEIASGAVFSSWRIQKKIGQGACSDVYIVTRNNEKDTKEYAMKVSPIPEIKAASSKTKKRTKTEAERAADALYAEHLLYQGYISGHPGIPILPPNAYGEAQGYRYLVLELLGKNLQQIVDENGCIPTGTVARLGIEILDILKHLHSKKILFVDIKPENFMLNRNVEDRVYCVDFGLSERYILATGRHKEKKTSGIVGTPTFLSLHVHEGTTPSRRDDIEGLIYVLIYLLKGSLPWSQAKSDQEGAKLKKEISCQELCQGLSEVWIKLLEHVRSYEFDQEPNYLFIKSLLLQAADGNIPSGTYEWKSSSKEKMNKQQKKETANLLVEKNSNEDQVVKIKSKKLPAKSSKKQPKVLKSTVAVLSKSPRKPRKAAIAARQALMECF